MKTRFLTILTVSLLFSCSGNVMQTTVFSDGFASMEKGAFKPDKAVSPAICFHEQADSSESWSVATSLRQDGYNHAWEINEENGNHFLAQNFINLDKQNEPLSLITHPMIVAGDSMWSDYMIEVDFTPHAIFDKCGVVFGYQHPNDYYFFGTEGNTVILKHIQQSVTPLRPIERILAYRPVVWTPGDEMHAVVTVRRKKISTILNDSIRMYEGAELVRPGKIGLISDLPASFHRVEVKMLKGELRQLNRRKRQLVRRQEIHLKGHPQMVKWKSFDISEIHPDHNLRLGDLNGDGNKELLFFGDADRGTGQITALNLTGEVLWQHKFRSSASEPCVEKAVQIHDLDGDLQREVIFAGGRYLRVLDGLSGKQKHRVRLPWKGEPESIIFGNLQGSGNDDCLIITDRSTYLAAYDDQLQLLWEQELEGGCQPELFDMDADTLDEILIGYAAYDHDGSLLFNSGRFIGDECNGVVVSELMEGHESTPCIIYAAGDWGLLYSDFEGHILKQNVMGHVKYCSVGEYDMESPGLEVVTSNRWGSDGLVHICNAEGKVLKNFMGAAGVSRCEVVNWKGDGEEFFIMNADSIAGGMFDKNGELSVRFPADGHPVSYYMVRDLYGDARDEILVWDESQMWIYTQDDNPRMGHTYEPGRQPTYNQSMLRMSWSKPGV